MFPATTLCLVAAEYPKAKTKCTQNNDCASYEHCNTSGRCAHNSLFPLRNIEIGGFVVYTAIVFFCNFSGMQGGLPLTAFISMFNFNMKLGIMLSNAQIASAGLTRLVMDAGKSHPLRKQGILLDYAILTMMLPFITVGSTLASVVSRLMPDIYITIFYAIIMTAILVFNIFRLISLVRKEMKAAASKPPEAIVNPKELPIESEQELASARSPIKAEDVYVEVQEDTGEAKKLKLEFPDDEDEINYKFLCLTRKTTKQGLRKRLE
jgi:hypothetical protein